ncbi:MAG TPA: IclR family transcriptional regulator [Candidatus Synoicihabitans sp.]|nr:IclR family transcriptional regulator [Candidatus Synoicihabitans sp.]
MAAAPDYPVPALEKGLDLLEALASAPVPQSLAELAASLQRSSSELFRMLNCLERRGWIIRDVVSGKYRLSLRLYALAHTHSPTEQLLRAARRPMQALTEQFHQSCHLSVLDRGQLLVIAQQESPGQVRLSIEVGGTFEPARTASGRLLLAHLETDERTTALAALRPAQRRALEPLLAELRRTGVSIAESETIEGVRDLAVVVGDPAVGVAAALAVTRLQRRDTRVNETALLGGLRTTAADINRTLGFTP